MPKEIERKFLVPAVPFDLSMHPETASFPFHLITQGYLAKTEDAPSVRVVKDGHDGLLQLRGMLSIDVRVPLVEAELMYELYANQDGWFDKLRGPAIRFRLQDGEGFLTIKGKASDTGMSRDEFEYPISGVTAQQALDIYCPKLRLRKVRYCIPHGEFTIELDVFQGPLKGLVLAEVELPAEDTPFTPPAWFGIEVTKEKGYSNFSLAERVANIT